MFKTFMRVFPTSHKHPRMLFLRIANVREVFQEERGTVTRASHGLDSSV